MSIRKKKKRQSRKEGRQEGREDLLVPSHAEPARSHMSTCFDHNSSKSTNFAASDMSWKRSRIAVNVGELLIRIERYFCYENGAASREYATADCPEVKMTREMRDSNDYLEIGTLKLWRCRGFLPSVGKSVCKVYPVLIYQVLLASVGIIRDREFDQSVA